MGLAYVHVLWLAALWRHLSLTNGRLVAYSCKVAFSLAWSPSLLRPSTSFENPP